MTSRVIYGDFTICICGSAGQGIQTIESGLVRTLKSYGYNVYATKEYMSRVRGGTNSTTIRVSSNSNESYRFDIDLVLSLSNESISHLKDRLRDDTIIIGDNSKLNDSRVYDLNLSLLGQELGNKVYANYIALGLILGILKVDIKVAKDLALKSLKSKEKQVIDGNINALAKGFHISYDFLSKLSLEINIKSNQRVKNDYLMSGADALSLGFISGGCNMVCAYPMSPSTPILTYLAEHGPKFGVITEQVEDEIAAVNMAIGAWYAGARALANTSGGGFALMCEGISLAGIIESPLVVHIAQRPGPATGLPTRTEQADLNLALYSGHGEFPRVILAPKSIEDCYRVGELSFEIADRYQIPVFVLTDQNLIDSISNLSTQFTPKGYKNYISSSSVDYKRYELTKSGLSNRSVPAYGEGLVVVDSDEHDEEGHLTEDLDTRVKMMQKRFNKVSDIESILPLPTYIGKDNAKTLVISWGSNYSNVLEAIRNIQNKDFAFLHFNALYPVHKSVEKYILAATNIICIENNYTGQFANLIEHTFNVRVKNRILKYDGNPFSSNELYDKLQKVI